MRYGGALRCGSFRGMAALQYVCGFILLRLCRITVFDGGRLLTVRRDLCRGAEYGFARRKFNLEENNFIIHSDAAGGSAPRRIFLGYAD